MKITGLTFAGYDRNVPDLRITSPAWTAKPFNLFPQLDAPGNMIAANSIVDFKTFMFERGWAHYDRWHNENGDPDRIGNLVIDCESRCRDTGTMGSALEITISE